MTSRYKFIFDSCSCVKVNQIHLLLYTHAQFVLRWCVGEVLRWLETKSITKHTSSQNTVP